MSKVGLSRRVLSLGAALKSHDPYGWAVYNLSPGNRRIFDEWQVRCKQVVAQRYGDDDSALYAALIDGDDATPPMPVALERHLSPDGGRTSQHFPVGTPLHVIADAYAAMLEEGIDR